MKWCLVAGCLLACTTMWAAASGDVARAQSVITTIGEFRVVHDEGSDAYAAVLNGKVLVDNGSSPIFLSPLLKGKAQDFILIYKSSGGIACRGMFQAVRVRSPVVLSEEFGSCAESFRARVEGDRLVVTMPAYVGQPELFEKAELDRLKRTELVYTYVDGLLSEREVTK